MFSDGFEMLIQTFLRRTIEQGVTVRQPTTTTVIEALRQANGFRSSVSAGPGNYRNAPISQIQRHHHHISMFVMI